MTTAIQQTKPETATEKAMEFIPFGAADKIKLNVAIIQNSVCIPTKSGKTCTVRDAVRFMMLCQAQRLNPFAGDCYLTGYDGKNGPVFSLITAHVAFLKRAETCPDYEGMESGIILMDDETKVVSEREGDFKLKTEICVGGWARVFRKGRKPTYRRLSIAAMIPTYETPFWSEDKAPGQIVKCAEADALRATFPTLLGGLYSGEELKMSDTVFSVISADIAPAFVQAPGEAPRQIPQEAEKKPAKSTPQQELEGVILAAGHSFNDFTTWAACSQMGFEGADSLTCMGELQTPEAVRVLRISHAMLKEMGEMKGGAK